MTYDSLVTAQTAEFFYSSALDRIRRIMVVLAMVLTAAGWAFWGWRAAVGLLCGCAVSYLNFHWLKGVVSSSADRATRTGRVQSTAGMVVRFLLRYLLMGAVAYAIFSVSPASLRGLFVGLLLPVGAIMCEAVYEVYAAVTRGV